MLTRRNFPFGLRIHIHGELNLLSVLISIIPSCSILFSSHSTSLATIQELDRNSDTLEFCQSIVCDAILSLFAQVFGKTQSLSIHAITLSINRAVLPSTDLPSTTTIKDRLLSSRLVLKPFSGENL